MSETGGHDEILAVFLAECDECLISLEEGLVLLETNPDDAEAINTIFRAAHTLKGTSAMVGFLSLVPLAHSMENVLDGIREGRLKASSAVISLLLISGDAFRKMLPRATAGDDEVPPETISLMAALDAIANDEDAVGELFGLQPGIMESERAAPVNEGSGAKSRRIRVGLDKLDSLLDLTGEIVISLGRTRAAAEALDAKQREYILECLSGTEVLPSDLREQVMNVRMLPVGNAFEPHKRTVRDIAQLTGKEVRLEIEGAEVEIDASIIEQIKDPLTHMIRKGLACLRE